MMDLDSSRRIIIVGVTSAGKTTLGQNLGNKLSLPFYDMDSLYWGPGWTPKDPQIFFDLIERATRGESWILAGNYSSVRSLCWSRADTIIWLDYPFHRVLGRLFIRTVKRSWNRELLWGNNRETFGKHLKIWSDESLFYWLVKTYWRRKKQFPQILSLPEFGHLKVFRLRNVHTVNRIMFLSHKELDHPLV